MIKRNVNNRILKTEIKLDQDDSANQRYFNFIGKISFRLIKFHQISTVYINLLSNTNLYFS